MKKKEDSQSKLRQDIRIDNTNSKDHNKLLYNQLDNLEKVE